MPFHATLNSHGEQFTFDRGGYYEKVDEYGTPVQRGGLDGFIGFAMSDTSELAASYRPEAAVFAVIKNLVNDTGDAGGAGGSIPVNVYDVSGSPDVDMSDAVVGDFALIDEVRYREPEENPVSGELAYRVRLPAKVMGDVELTYLPGHGHVIESWGRAVQDAIRQVLDGGEYPDDVAEWSGVKRPDLEAYRPEHA